MLDTQALIITLGIVVITSVLIVYLIKTLIKMQVKQGNFFWIKSDSEFIADWNFKFNAFTSEYPCLTWVSLYWIVILSSSLTIEQYPMLGLTILYSGLFSVVSYIAYCRWRSIFWGLLGIIGLIIICSKENLNKKKQ